MADLGHGELLFKEGSDNAQTISVVPNIFRRTPARNHQSDVIVRVYVCEGEVGIPTVTGLLGVCVKAWLKIVDNKMQFLFCGRCDFDVVTLLLQPLVWIYHLERFSGIAGQY